MAFSRFTGAALLALVSFCVTSGAALAAFPVPWQINFQEPASPIMHEIYNFHHLLLIIITAITIFVLGLLLYICVRFRASRNPVPSKTSHNTVIEIIWTAVPVLILVFIAIKSFPLIYKEAEAPDAQMTIKVLGSQWFWTYEYPDHGGFTFDSYMVEDKDLKPGQIRLLEVDNRIVVPVDTVIRVQMTAADVIHSWAIPALGVKKDAVPGRLNETWFKAEKPGVYYGQCSELCGVKHGFMPIAVEAVSKEQFAAWVASKGGKMPEAVPVAQTQPTNN